MARYAAPPVPVINLRDLWLQRAHRPSSRTGRAATLRPIDARPAPCPDLILLARAVIRRAVYDANPTSPPFWAHHPRPDDPAHPEPSRDRLADEYDALLFLTDPDDVWLETWCHWANYTPYKLRRRFGPLRHQFEQRYTIVPSEA